MSRKILVATLTVALCALGACGSDGAAGEKTTAASSASASSSAPESESASPAATPDRAEVISEVDGENTKYSYEGVTIVVPSSWIDLELEEDAYVIKRASAGQDASIILTDIGPSGVFPGDEAYLELLKKNLGEGTGVTKLGTATIGQVEADLYKVVGPDYVANIYSFEHAKHTYELTVNALDDGGLQNLQQYIHMVETT